MHNKARLAANSQVLIWILTVGLRDTDLAI